MAGSHFSHPSATYVHRFHRRGRKFFGAWPSGLRPPWPDGSRRAPSWPSRRTIGPEAPQQQPRHRTPSPGGSRDGRSACCSAHQLCTVDQEEADHSVVAALTCMVSLPYLHRRRSHDSQSLREEPRQPTHRVPGLAADQQAPDTQSAPRAVPNRRPGQGCRAGTTGKPVSWAGQTLA